MAYQIVEGTGWWRTRWLILSAGDSSQGDRLWSAGELACAAVTLATLAISLGVVIADPFTHIPWVLRGWPMQLAIAGAVGYGTNFLAVQMLFKPRTPSRALLLRWVWPQGLIPAKQAEMAEVVGEEVARRLLTPEAIVDEFARLVELALDDPKTFEQFQRFLNQTLARELPALIRKFLPETLGVLERSMLESLSPEEVRRVLLEVIDDWFRSNANRESLGRFLVGLVRAWSPEVVVLLRAAVKRYKKTSSARRFAIDAGLSMKIVDWDDFEKSLRRQLATEKSHDWALEIVSRFATEIHIFAAELIDSSVLEQLEQRTGHVALESVARAAEHTLVPRLIALIDGARFKSFVVDELIPRLKPRVLEWVRGGQLAPVLERFDVRGRVAGAASALSVAELEDMANRIGAYHLAAIQVLGYVLGLAVGVLAVFVGAAD